MPDYTVSLSSSQNDALQFLTELARVDQDNEALTAEEVLQTFVGQVLYSTEVAIEATMQALVTAGNALPAVVREWMTENLTVPEMERLVHLQTPVGDAAQG